MTGGIVEKIRNRGLMPAALRMILPGRPIPDDGTRAFQCIRPGAHRHGDRTPSCYARTQLGGIHCEGCGLDLSLLQLAVETNYAPTEAEAAARLEADLHLNNGNGCAAAPAEVTGAASATGGGEGGEQRSEEEKADLLRRYERVLHGKPEAIAKICAGFSITEETARFLRLGWKSYGRGGRPARVVIPATHGDRVLTMKLRLLSPVEGEAKAITHFRCGAKTVFGRDFIDRAPTSWPIWWASGEKDWLVTYQRVRRGAEAERVDAVVVSATAGEHKPPDDLETWAPGRDHVVFVDLDGGIGRRKAEALGAKLLSVGAASVRLVELQFPEGDGPRKDLFDFFARGGTVADLARQVTSAPEFAASTARTVSGAISNDRSGRADWSQDSLALDMARHWGNARFVAPWGRWYFWNGVRWKPDETLDHLTRCRDYLRRRAEALLLEDPTATAAAKDVRSSKTVAAVVGLARSNPSCVAAVDIWDRDPFILGTPAGTVDLRTGSMRDARPDDYVTMSTTCAPAPAGTAPVLWTKFLDRVTGGDAELIAYLQRLAGYSLTGSTREHALAFAHGVGQNGKSVFLNTLGRVWGDYSVAVPTEMLMVSPTDRHPTELARLRGVRLAIGSETEDGRQWAEARIKALTGGDIVTARFMRADFFDYVPQFKLLICGNHAPTLRAVDKAIRRRLHLIPFTVTIPDSEVDKNLPEKLAAEGPAILRWAIDGCVAWQRDGLAPPGVVLDATASYLDEEDSVRQWMDDCGTLDPNAWESIAELWTSWSAWAKTAGEIVGNKNRLSRRLPALGLVPTRKTFGRGFTGFRLNPSEQEDYRYGE